jgi:hypothetical protein
MTETRRGRIITWTANVRLWRAQAIDRGWMSAGGRILFEASGETEVDALAALAEVAIETYERTREDCGNA